MRLIPILIAGLSVSPATAAETLRCDDPLISVEAADRATALRACQAAGAARASLQSCGIIIEGHLDIAVVDSIASAFGDCLGLYHCGEHRIEILSPLAMPGARRADSAFAAVPDDAFWDSVLVHEMTHAAYDMTVSCPYSSCVATSEYASFAMQVHSLDDTNRALFLQSDPDRSTPERDAISAIIYAMAPDIFAVNAWLHFSTRPDPCAYLRRIFDGDIIFDREPL